MGVLPQVTNSHAGICPNDMNPNLWVDAMSTCTRECESDTVKYGKNEIHVFIVLFFAFFFFNVVLLQLDTVNLLDISLVPYLTKA